jgi:hypothetical protein
MGLGPKSSEQPGALSWMLRPSRPLIVLDRFLIAGMALVAILGLTRQNHAVIALAAAAVLCSLVPGWLRRRYQVALPGVLEFLIVLQLALHVLGVWLRLYDTHWFWDKILHVQGTMIVSFLGFLWLHALHATGRLRLSGPLLGLFTLVIGNALGAWWEIVEFIVDKTLGKHTQYSLDNTMWDLIDNLVGSLLAAGLGWVYAHHADRVQQRRLAVPMARTLGTLLLDRGKSPKLRNHPQP